MITLGVADAIVDLVETGSTLAANQLRVLDEIGRYETILVQNKHKRARGPGQPRGPPFPEGVVMRGRTRCCEYNIPSSRLAEAEKLTPGFHSPTVNAARGPAVAVGPRAWSSEATSST